MVDATGAVTTVGTGATAGVVTVEGLTTAGGETLTGDAITREDGASWSGLGTGTALGTRAGGATATTSGVFGGSTGRGPSTGVGAEGKGSVGSDAADVGFATFTEGSDRREAVLVDGDSSGAVGETGLITEGAKRVVAGSVFAIAGAVGSGTGFEAAPETWPLSGLNSVREDSRGVTTADFGGTGSGSIATGGLAGVTVAITGGTGRSGSGPGGATVAMIGAGLGGVCGKSGVGARATFSAAIPVDGYAGAVVTLRLGAGAPAGGQSRGAFAGFVTTGVARTEVAGAGGTAAATGDVVTTVGPGRVGTLRT